MKSKHNKKFLLIGTSGMCNAKCPYCAQWRLRKENHFGGIMSPILFKRIIDHIFKIGIEIRPMVAIYGWGEPFLNPKINDILQILKNRELEAGISSNFIIRPNIDKKLLSTIRSLTFSLSGFSQETYGRIHGASLEKVLNNFESFYSDLRKYSPDTEIKIAWHRYLFNENEFWRAHKYFNRPGIRVSPAIPYFDDGIDMMKFLKGKLSKNRLEKASKELFLNRILKRVDYYKKKSKNYYCPEWDGLAIDEIGQLLTCCAFTRYDSDHVLGNVLEMSAEEILNIRDPFCSECISSGFAGFAHNQIESLPPGGGLYGLKTKFYYIFYNILRQPAQILKKFSYSGKIVKVVKKSIWHF